MKFSCTIRSEAQARASYPSTFAVHLQCIYIPQEIATVKNDAERDFAAAKPALDAALSALNSITPKDIVGLKALKNPPDVVKRIFDCVLLLR
jgi:Microtubule-binding stalk of dynein motor